MEEFDFIGCGEASNKRDAQSLAAQSFCKYLVEQGLVDPSTLPVPLEVRSIAYNTVPLTVIRLTACV